MKTLDQIKQQMIEMYAEGYMSEELDNLIDEYFEYNFVNNACYFLGEELNQKSIDEGIIAKIVALSSTMYISDEMDELLELLTKIENGSN